MMENNDDGTTNNTSKPAPPAHTATAGHTPLNKPGVAAVTIFKFPHTTPQREINGTINNTLMELYTEGWVLGSIDTATPNTDPDGSYDIIVTLVMRELYAGSGEIPTA